jgi:hypothetical protein
MPWFDSFNGFHGDDGSPLKAVVAEERSESFNPPEMPLSPLAVLIHKEEVSVLQTLWANLQRGSSKKMVEESVPEAIPEETAVLGTPVIIEESPPPVIVEDPASANPEEPPVEPVIKESAEPAIIEEPTPVIIEDPPPADPVIIEEPTPVIIEDPTPVIIEDPTPVIIEDPTPVIIEDPTPVIIEDPPPVIIEDPPPAEPSPPPSELAESPLVIEPFPAELPPVAASVKFDDGYDSFDEELDLLLDRPRSTVFQKLDFLQKAILDQCT